MLLSFLKRLSKAELVKMLVVLAALGFIAYLCITLRSSTLSSPTVLDYDPWWFFRHAQEILDNGFRLPAWDELSYYPPGRPMEAFQGWPFTMAFMYQVARVFSTISFVELAKWSPIIMVVLTIPPAYFLGKTLSNRWGGILTALFSVLTPTFIGVSMGGYCDSDVVVVLYSLLLVFTVFLALKKWSWPLKKSTLFYLALPILVNTAFVYSWGRGWYILLFFAVFIPTLLIFRVIQEIIGQRKFKINLSPIITEAKRLFIPLIIIFIITNIIGVVFGISDFYSSIVGGYFFVTGQRLIVNISVAELQTIDIFTMAGFDQIASRVGVGPMLFTIIGLPLPRYSFSCGQ
jgi:asparagine N-glycosylation enzyme membrane subunit Stt3